MLLVPIRKKLTYHQFDHNVQQEKYMQIHKINKYISIQYISLTYKTFIFSHFLNRHKIKLMKKNIYFQYSSLYLLFGWTDWNISKL